MGPFEPESTSDIISGVSLLVQCWLCVMPSNWLSGCDSSGEVRATHISQENRAPAPLGTSGPKLGK